jgi:hypothetical protein
VVFVLLDISLPPFVAPILLYISTLSCGLYNLKIYKVPTDIAVSILLTLLLSSKPPLPYKIIHLLLLYFTCGPNPPLPYTRRYVGTFSPLVISLSSLTLQQDTYLFSPCNLPFLPYTIQEDT